MNSTEPQMPDANALLNASGDHAFLFWLVTGLGVIFACFLMVDMLREGRRRKAELSGQMQSGGQKNKRTLIRRLGRWLFATRY